MHAHAHGCQGGRVECIAFRACLELKRKREAPCIHKANGSQCQGNDTQAGVGGP